MMNKTSIEYLTHTWNPFAMRCSPCSKGCLNCWHLRYADRLAKNPKIPEQERKAYAGGTPVLIDQRLAASFNFRKPAVIGVQLMGDLFHESVPFERIMHIFWKMQNEKDNVIFLILTKRSKRMLEFWNWYKDKYYIYPNEYQLPIPEKALEHIWIGVSVENQRTANERISDLLQISGTHFVSYEPALELVNFRHIDAEAAGHKEWCVIDALTGKHTDMGRPCPDVPRLNWVIMGAESNFDHRLMDIEWAKSIVRQCKATNVPLFYKQGPDDFGNDFIKMPILLGKVWDEKP